MQLYEPPTVCEWQACWAILKTGAIVLQELSPSTLDLWEKVVTNYAGRYGLETWALIYQAEVKARLEHMSRVRREGAAAKAQATAAGGDHPFKPDSPWEWVHRETAHDAGFWRTGLEEPALLIKAQVARMSVSTGGDTPLNESVAVAKNSEYDARTFWIFVGFAGRAGLPDGLGVLTRSKGQEYGLDVQVVVADSVNNVDLLDDLVWNAVETRLARSSVFAASVWVSFL